jgi:hypothetical protein
MARCFQVVLDTATLDRRRPRKPNIARPENADEKQSRPVLWSSVVSSIQDAPLHFVAPNAAQSLPNCSEAHAAVNCQEPCDVLQHKSVGLALLQILQNVIENDPSSVAVVESCSLSCEETLALARRRVFSAHPSNTAIDYSLARPSFRGRPRPACLT